MFQPIIEGEQAVSANDRRGARSVRQSQKEGSAKCQPIKGGKREVSAEQRRGVSGLGKSQEESHMFQPIM
jgi:hypothetical protein